MNAAPSLFRCARYDKTRWLLVDKGLKLSRYLFISIRRGFFSVSIRFLFQFFLLVLWSMITILSPVRAEERTGSPAARLLSNEFASEHWEITTRLDSGHLVFVDFLITNIGWGDRNAAVIGHVVAPDGKVYSFDNARHEGQWQLSPDHLRFEVGPNVLDLHEPIYQLSVNKKDVRLNLRFRADGPAIRSDALTQSSYTLELLAAAVPTEGVLWVKDMKESLPIRGVLAATHSWLKEAGSALVLRRLEFFTLREDFPFYGIDITTPAGKHSRWLVGKQQEKRFYELEAFDLEMANEHDFQKDDPGYAVPGKIQFKNPLLNGQVQLERVALRNDPFAKLSRPVRFLASMTLNLHPRRIWAFSPFTMTLQPAPLGASSLNGFTLPTTQSGVGVIAITFLNPLSKMLRLPR
jgi:hypothetical protein